MVTVTESGTIVASVSAKRPPGRFRHFLNQRMPLIVFLLILAIGWEATKFIGGQVWRVEGEIAGQPIEFVWKPPLKFQFANDLNLPHIWDIFGALGRPAQRGGSPLLLVLIEASWFTFRVALVGFALGTVTGLTLAIVFTQSRLLNRAFVPYVVASQTVPILVVAPIVVIWLRAGWFSIAIIAMYLTFFPVTISALRGLKSISPEMIELIRTYAASPLQILLKLRLPAALSYMFVGFKIAATASIIGAIVGELPSGISEGLGALVLNFAQYYSTGPAKLWACIIVIAVVGIGTYLLVDVAEKVFFRNRFHHTEDV